MTSAFLKADDNSILLVGSHEKLAELLKSIALPVCFTSALMSYVRHFQVQLAVNGSKLKAAVVEIDLPASQVISNPEVKAVSFPINLALVSIFFHGELTVNLLSHPFCLLKLTVEDIFLPASQLIS